MNAATHIIGGYVFAGTLCSFTDVNIFERPEYLIVCAACYIIPDVDTTRSLIGKLLYPFAWIINRKLGHRTFTHSLLFLALAWFIIWALIKFQVVKDPNYTKIVLFSILSHFVFDMVTVSGVPLLYPWFKNPCVIPGNKHYRFNTGEWRSELIIAGICGILCITMQPLFANGFWTSYHRTFGTIKHVNRENSNTEFYVICEYSYILNAELYEGEAIVITSNDNEITLFDGAQIFTLDSNNPQLKVNHTRPRISDIEKRFKELHFFNISIDSIQDILQGKIATGLIQSNHNIRYIENAITYNTNFVQFKNRFDFRIFAESDTVRINIRTNIARLEASIAQYQQRHQTALREWQAHQNNISNIEENLRDQSLSNYDRNRLQQELIRQRNRNIERPVYNPPVVQMAELEAQRRAITERQLLFSGHVTLLYFGYDAFPTDDEQPDGTHPEQHENRTPNFSGQTLLAQESNQNRFNSNR